MGEVELKWWPLIGLYASGHGLFGMLLRVVGIHSVTSLRPALG